MLFTLLGPRETSEFRFDRIGWAAARCEQCECIQPFQVYRKWRIDSLEDALDLGETDLGLVRICGFCRNHFRIKTKSLPKTVERWQPSDGLQSLVDATLPDAGEVPERSERSREELRALLRGITTEARNIRANTTKAMLASGAMTAVVLPVLAWLLDSVGLALPVFDLFGQISMLFMMGFVVGGAVGHVRETCRQHREAFLRQLRESIAEHHINVDRLLEMGLASGFGLGMARDCLDRARHDPTILEDMPQGQDD